mgnify:CR=1 FL=1
MRLVGEIDGAVAGRDDGCVEDSTEIRAVEVVECRRRGAAGGAHARDQRFHAFARLLGHFAGADQKDLFAFQTAKNFAGQLDRRVTDGHCPVADGGFGANPFGNEKGPVQRTGPSSLLLRLPDYSAGCPALDLRLTGAQIRLLVR